MTRPLAAQLPELLLGALGAVSVAVVACSDPTAGPGSTPSGKPTSRQDLAAGNAASASSGPVRLINRLGEAHVESPLKNVQPLASLSEAGGSVSARTVFSERFERFSRAGANWPQAAGCTAVPRPGEGQRGRALHYKGRGGHRCIFVLPAEPSTYYRVSRQVRTEHAQVDFRLLEAAKPLAHPKVLNHPKDQARLINGRFVRLKDLLFVHHFDRPEARGSWEESSLVLFTTPYTRSLVLMVQDAEAAIAGQARQAWFDDLVVERLVPSSEQELGLLKAAYPLPVDAEAAGLGIAKRGQLLPVGNAETVVPPYDDNFDYRDALLAVAPTRITYPVDVPERARLRFSVSLFETSRPGDAVLFRVVARGAGGVEQQLYQRRLELDADRKAWHWTDESIDLSALAGQRVQLTFETHSAGGDRGYGLWGDPTLDVPRARHEPPNVILLGIDTLRADRLSAYGYSRRTSSHLDALARDGVLFEQAISASNWTSSSFASLFTGLMPSEHQVIHRASAIPDELPTLATHLRAAGYATQGIVYKAYLYNMGFEQGFDRWFNVPRHTVRADDSLEKALAWLDVHGDRRFFLFLHFNDPHQPFNQPAPFDRRFNRAETLGRLGVELPIVIDPNATRVQGCRRCVSRGKLVPGFRPLASDLYDGEIAYLDDRLGRLFTALKERGLYDSSVIALVSDHGESIWDHNDFFGHGGATLYDELIRVPLVIKPAKGQGMATGKTVRTEVRAFDLMPTLLELAGVDLGPIDVTARSLVDLMRAESLSGGAAPPAVNRVCVSENVKHHVVSVRHRGYKYVLSHRPGPRNRPVQESLYDLGSDPVEARDLIRSADPEHRDRLRALRRHAMEHLLRSRRGRYLLVSGTGQPGPYRVQVTADGGVSDVQSLFGLPLRSQKKRRVLVFEGTAGADNVVLLARVDTPAGGGLQVQVRSLRDPAVRLETVAKPSSFGAYRAGMLQELSQSRALTASFVEVQGGVKRAERRRLNAQRLESLRALGYVQ